MAYDEVLEQRMLAVLGGRPGMVSKKMFGGVGVLLNGNMACGVNGDRLIVRVGPDRYEDALSDPHAGPFDLTGRPMKGWVYVSPEAVAEDVMLAAWIERGVSFALSLPPK